MALLWGWLADVLVLEAHRLNCPPPVPKYLSTSISDVCWSSQVG